MKLIRAFAMLTILASGSLAAADAPAEKAPTAAPATEVGAEDVKKWLAFFDKVVETVLADKADCDKLAGDLTTLFDANAATIATAHELKAAGRKLPKSAQDHMIAGVKKMESTMQKCMTNAKVKAVFERFAGPPAKAKGAK